MKYTFLAVAACVLFAACSGETKSGSTNETEAGMGEMHHDMEGMHDDMHMAHAKMDPVCEMDYDASWTEYSVNGTDTMWFCSETCKGAYEGNPEKYTKEK
ncbi:MAG: hypothetical protein KDC07_00270 [Chitinophagaceae bacterium]|nr:hypothetical protein [Chitinophagaceae bacterium]